MTDAPPETKSDTPGVFGEPEPNVIPFSRGAFLQFIRGLRALLPIAAAGDIDRVHCSVLEGDGIPHQSLRLAATDSYRVVILDLPTGDKLAAPQRPIDHQSSLSFDLYLDDVEAWAAMRWRDVIGDGKNVAMEISDSKLWFRCLDEFNFRVDTSAPEKFINWQALIPDEPVLETGTSVNSGYFVEIHQIATALGEPSARVEFTQLTTKVCVFSCKTKDLGIRFTYLLAGLR